MNSKDKKNLLFYENSIKKSNELSMAKINQGLSLNQMQLFAYAIFSTQQDGKTEFRKHEFEKKFKIDQFRPNDAMDDAYRLLDLKIHVKDSNNEKGRGHNVFSDYYYDRGQFSFNWNEKFLPHILELKEKYIITDLNIASQFRSSFTWILYEYLKANYGYWYIEKTKEELLELFSVEEVRSYINNTSIFKKKVLNVAILEINKYTELNVWYKQVKRGRAITGFKLYWTSNKREKGATNNQISLLREIHNEVERRLFDYLSLNNQTDLEIARINIMKIEDINNQINELLTFKKAKEFIEEAKMLYEQLQLILESDGKRKDTSFYYNWLED